MFLICSWKGFYHLQSVCWCSLVLRVSLWGCTPESTDDNFWGGLFCSDAVVSQILHFQLWINCFHQDEYFGLLPSPSAVWKWPWPCSPALWAQGSAAQQPGLLGWLLHKCLRNLSRRFLGSLTAAVSVAAQRSLSIPFHSRDLSEIFSKTELNTWQFHPAPGKLEFGCPWTGP